jgi:hypothetical protein
LIRARLEKKISSKDPCAVEICESQKAVTTRYRPLFPFRSFQSEHMRKNLLEIFRTTVRPIYGQNMSEDRVIQLEMLPRSRCFPLLCSQADFEKESP